MIADPRAARPGVALRPIAKTGDLKCRILGIDHGARDRRRLRRATASQVQPRIRQPAGHHRWRCEALPQRRERLPAQAVEVFLDEIGTVRQAPRGLLGWANIGYTAASYILLRLPALLALLGAPDEWILGRAAGIGDAQHRLAMIVVVPGYRWARTPAGSSRPGRRQRLRTRAQRYAMTTFPANRVGNPTSAWANYHAVLKQQACASRHRRLRPGPAGQGRDVSKVLQYWLFYYYNDWWNSHEADWEVAMVYLGDDDQPIAAACSSHLSGTWRPWPAVEGVSDTATHPRIYVARGSHAMYFNVSGGHPLRGPAAAVGGVRLQRPAAREGQQGRGRAAEGGARHVPPRDHADEPGTRGAVPGSTRTPRGAWRRWWWLRFEGRWGQRDGILSPAIQEDQAAVGPARRRGPAITAPPTRPAGMK